MNKKPISYLQTDPKWGSLDYSAPGEKTTIARSGCGPTAAAMVVATLAAQSVTPVTACNWAKEHGYKCKGNGTYYSFFTPYGKKYGLVWEQINWSDLRKVSAASAAPYHDKALKAVQNGDMVIACMGPGNWTTGGHFILWYAVDDQGMVYINDPASTKAGRLKNTLALLRSQVKYYFICHTPENKKEDDMDEAKVNALIGAALERWKESQYYPTLAQVPESYRPTIRKMMEAKALVGYDVGDESTIEDNKIKVDETFCRIATTFDRMGAMDLFIETMKKTEPQA